MRRGIFAIALCWAFASYGRVLDFHCDIRIARSGELTVTERFTLLAPEGLDGFVRQLPAPVRVVDVIRNGHPEHYVVNDGRLVIGREPLQVGRHLYQLSYRTQRQVVFLERHDELRWDVRGAERITAEVVLPAAVPARDIVAEISGTDPLSLVRDGRAAFRAKDGMAIVVRFPKDVVSAPGAGERARWFLTDYLGLLLVAALLSLAAAVLIHLKTLSARP